MTNDAGEENVINAIITTKGNHARGHYNQRQIDVIREEILKEIDVDHNDIGIISPYREQVSELQKALPDEISIDTVHKFQGREKDTIIISTVDNVTNDFSDNPNLINVAISRAKNRLYIVSSGNEKAGNIYDLIEYIKYNNCEVRESKVNSIFDYLYTQYSEELRRYLKGKRRISEYNSENLMYSLLNEIFEEHGWNELEVLCHVSLRNIINDTSVLNVEEQWYAMNPLTHIDFSIVNRVTKKYVLAIEVDGYAFHKGKNRDAQKQAKRDMMKDHIFEKYGLNILRFTTNESAEKEIIIRKLKELMTNGTV